MSRDPNFGSREIRRQFSELATIINDDLTVYLIGGGALTLEEMKNGTKDIDLIVRERSELKQLWHVLRSAGYEPQEELTEEYDELEAAFILEKDDRRFDVFHGQVAGVISLSESMIARSHHLFEEDGLSVEMVSLNDIFLFKAVANREDDVDDMITIAEGGIDEDVIVEETMTQLELLESDDFIGSMKQKLDRLEEQGLALDIQREVQTLYERTKDGYAVRNAVISLQEHEYDDDLYSGVPKPAIERRVGEEVASSGIAWLDSVGIVERVADGSVVLTE